MNWKILLPELYFFGTAAVFFTLAMLPRSDPRRDYGFALALYLGAKLYRGGERLFGATFDHLDW